MILPNLSKSPLLFIEKLALLIYTALTFGSLVFWDLRITLGVFAGGAFALLNFRLLRFVVGRALTGSKTPRPMLLLLLVPKFGLIAALLWLILRSAWFDVVGFCVGASSLFLAVTIAGIGFNSDEDASPDENGSVK